MNRFLNGNKTRRKFLRMLAASPVLAVPGLFGSSLLNLMAGGEVTVGKFRGWLDAFQQSDGVISSPEDALDVFDFEAASRKVVPPVHFGYLAKGGGEKATVRRAEAAGSPAIVLTVDLHDGSNRETLFRSQRVDKRECSMCHSGSYSPFGRGRTGAIAAPASTGFAGYVARKPMFNGLDVSKVTNLYPTNLNWDFVKRLRDTVTVKLLIKGIVTREDAQLALEHGVDGLVVSNHGGRAEESLRPTIESLPDVLEGVAGKVPVIVDGGVRRGTDIFKALALGASEVGIGRPHAWGLAAFGQPGVEAVLEILRRELRTIMRQAGTISVDKIKPNYIVVRSS